MNDVLPTYVDPCLSHRRNSTESSRLYALDFGECYPQPSDALTYPRLVPVYNGEPLNINSEFVHDSLSGISIKHYYGKCFKEEENLEKKDFYEEDQHYRNVHEKHKRKNRFSDKIIPHRTGTSESSSTESSFEYRRSESVERQPMCTLPKINYRNSFWNIHRPELCKLTWGQKYVGRTLVTEHLHEHLIHHGSLCDGFHTQEERECMLNKELDEYVRLKMLAHPRVLPPDEPLFNFKIQDSKILPNPKCKRKIPQPIDAINPTERYIVVDNDEEKVYDGGEIRIKPVQRSKEEFCLTIGKHIRKPPSVKLKNPTPESYEIQECHPCEEEEGGGTFYFNWLLYQQEECYGEYSDKIESETSSSSDYEPENDPCPPLMMDEFCKAAGKIKFDDIRCDPDF